MSSGYSVLKLIFYALFGVFLLIKFIVVSIYKMCKGIYSEVSHEEEKEQQAYDKWLS